MMRVIYFVEVVIGTLKWRAWIVLIGLNDLCVVLAGLIDFGYVCNRVDAILNLLGRAQP